MADVNPLVARVEVPPILEAHGWAARYDGALGPALDLCQAVPGYAPAPGTLEHLAAEAADPANAKYGLISGDLALRETYAADLSRSYGGRIGPDQVAITAGCNQAFFVAMLSVAQAGDAVLLPLPWFWNHQQTCTMLGIEPRPLPCRAEDGFVPDPALAENLLDARVRAIVLITPNNPTGAVYPPEVVAAFHALCARRGIWLILDETYRDFLPPGRERSHELFTQPDWADTVIQLYSFSKAYCVPGARIGAVTAASDLVAQFTKVLDCVHICPQRPAQAALRWAIAALKGWRAANRARINERGDAVRRAFERLPDWRIDSLGAYFAYVRHPFAGIAAPEVAQAMATELGAVCLPGTAFGPGQESHLRLAFANTETDGLSELAARLTRLHLPRRP